MVWLMSLWYRLDETHISLPKLVLYLYIIQRVIIWLKCGQILGRYVFYWPDRYHIGQLNFLLDRFIFLSARYFSYWLRYWLYMYPMCVLLGKYVIARYVYYWPDICQICVLQFIIVMFKVCVQFVNLTD